MASNGAATPAGHTGSTPRKPRPFCARVAGVGVSCWRGSLDRLSHSSREVAYLAVFSRRRNSSKDRKRLAPSPSCAIYLSTGVSREERSMAQRYRAGFVAALLISGLAVSSPAMAANIVLDPGFEQGDDLAPWVANPFSGGIAP